MPESPLHDVTIPIIGASLGGTMALPQHATGIVVFAHGSGSSRFSPRNREVASALGESGFGTLLFDLLTDAEEAVDRQTRQHRFDIPLLGERLIAATDWLGNQAETQRLDVGYFGASTGAAAALIAAAERPAVRAVVSRGGRPDLAGEALNRVHSPTLLIVGELDAQVIDMNLTAHARLRAHAEIIIVPGATHLFEEPGTMEQVTQHAVAWFRRYLNR